jgi:hypothetical protein
MMHHEALAVTSQEMSRRDSSTIAAEVLLMLFSSPVYAVVVPPACYFMRFANKEFTSLWASIRLLILFTTYRFLATLNKALRKHDDVNRNRGLKESPLGGFTNSNSARTNQWRLSA